MQYRNREEAGMRLAAELRRHGGQDTIIYALPRGGVVLGAEIARALGAQLDLVISRKIGHPFNPEYGIAAVTEHGEMVQNELETRNVDQAWFRREVEKGILEAKRRRKEYSGKHTPLSAKGKTAILVDDGIATGLTMEAAIAAIREQQPKRVVVAIPVVPRGAAERLKREADKLVALEIPDAYLGAVGAYYEEFPQLTDEEVIALINSARRKDHAR